MQQTAKLIMIAGIVIFVAGLALWGGGKYLHWFGHLPGDIRVEKENFKFYMPVTTMILVSVIVSLILWLIRRIGG
jgi:hypothetical protein